MKRIDLVSKLAAPIFVSVAAMLVQSLGAMTLAVAAMNVLLAVPELFFAKRVWLSCSRIREIRQVAAAVDDHGASEGANTSRLATTTGWGNGFRLYFGSDVWIRTPSVPSMSRSVANLNQHPFRLHFSPFRCYLYPHP
jgi:hypothetical protein